MKNLIDKPLKKYYLILLCFIGLSIQAQSEKNPVLPEYNNSGEEKQSKISFLERFSFKQNKIADHNPVLGSKAYFRNYMDYKSERIYFGIGAGLVSQRSYLNHMEPDKQIGVDALVEFSLNKTFSLYAFGRYLSKPLNNQNLMPTYSLDPFFFKTEIGAGLKGNFNNFQIDVGTRTALDAPTNQVGPKTRVNSSFSLDF